MTDTCRAVVFGGDGTWELRDDFSVPTPPPGGAVLAVEAVGLCHSDVAQLAGHKHVPGEVSPVVPGHEIVGRVH
ncbi:MAG: alcohol dehydrogenase catalytic domain-containing protein, partial [Acidimicrobiaceae bacterium]|nr:alcohol dehydrogenase catalytic domain-containing protein [Acidimicrobiaceae bacterium]